MSNRVKNWLLSGALAAALAEFIIIMVLLLPSPAGRAPEPQRLRAAAVPMNKLLVHEDSIQNPAPAKEAKPQEKEGPEDELPDREEEPEGEQEVQEKEKPAGELSAPEIMAGADIVAHGLGAIGNLRTPNCLEAFQAAYAKGVRVFEVDLRLTRDCQVVLHHDWWPTTWQEGIDWARIPTREKFLSEKILNKYTPMSFQDLLLLMEQYPDICVVTDNKFTESDVFYIQFDAMLADAHELGLTYLFDRIFVQIYSRNMKTALDNIYPFPHYIYTLYQDEYPFKGSVEEFRQRAAYARDKGIGGITMDVSWWKPAFAAIAEEYGVNLYVHTVNSADTAKRLLEEGASAVYTDWLRPKDLA